MKNLRFILLSSTLFAAPLHADTSEISAEATLRASLPVPLIPLPKSCTVKEGSTDFAGAPYAFSSPPAADPCFPTIATRLNDAFGKADKSTKARILLTLAPSSSTNPEAYTLTIQPSLATIKAASPSGLFHGVSTLIQLRRLKASTTLPHLEISDAPRLPFRAVMHDIGRGYMTPERVKRHIDILSQYKINVFHWHLTENQAWRFEVKKHPELTSAKFHEAPNSPGKFYSQAEIKDIIDYAKARNVIVVPELDIPGHTAALRRALGVKTMDDPKVAPVLRQAFTELLAITNPKDTPYVHIGSDEAKSNERLQKGLQEEIMSMIHKSGRKLIMWSPGHRPPPGDQSLEMLWAQAKPSGNNPFIDARSIYINLNTGADAVRTTYWNVPCTDGKPELRHGAGLALWLDLPTADENVERVAPFWPAIVTFADRTWHGGTFRQDLLVSLPELGTPEETAYTAFDKAVTTHRDTFFKGLPFPYVHDDSFWRLLGPIPNEGKDETAAFGPEINHASAAPITHNGITYNWDTTARGYQIFLRHMFGWSGALDDKTPVTSPWTTKAKRNNHPNTTVYARAVIESATDQTVGFWIQIDPPNASDRRDGSNPPLGKWNNEGAKVWINGQEIQPPQWKQPGMGANGGPNRFLPGLLDEYSHLRPAIPVQLKKGENTVILRLPSRGLKWEFICHPVEWDGTNAREAKGVTFKIF